MQDLRPYITDFSRGEVSGRFEGRYDLLDYYKSSRIMENMILQSTGGAEFIPGTVYLAAALDQAYPCRLIPFEYSEIESFMIEIGISGTDAYYKVWRVSDHTVSKALTQFGDNTWTAAEVRKIKVAPKGNAMYFVHPGHEPHKLTFTSPDTWVATAPVFTDAPWTDATDWPAAITFHEQRLVCARGLWIWGSKIQVPEDFGVNDPLDDASGYAFEIISDKNENALWLVSHNHLIIGTTGGEWRVHGGNYPITPLTLIDPKRQSTYGSVDIQGILANDAVVYAQKGGRRLRNFVYSLERGGYLSPDLTFLADHILKSGIVDMFFQQTPDPIIWCVRDDGTLVGLTFQELHSIAGWHRHPFDGSVEAGASVITNGAEDEVWIQTERTINSVTKRYLEYFKPHRHFTKDTQEDCFFMRCGKTFDGGAGESIEDASQTKPVVIDLDGHGFANDDLVKITGVVGMTELNTNVYMVKSAGADDFELYLVDGTTQLDGTGFEAYVSGGTVTKVYAALDGLTHLAAKTVDVLADGAAHPQKTVSVGGEITLDRCANKIHVGIPCPAQLKPQRFGQAPDRMKHIEKLTVRLYQTLGCKVGPDENNLEIIPFRAGTDPMDSPPPLFTGDKEVDFQGDYETGGDILIVQDQPLPLTVLSIMPSVGVYE